VSQVSGGQGMTEDGDKIKIGGLLRCCIETIDDLYAQGPGHRAAEGDVLPCKYCSHSVTFRSGAWEWNRAWKEGEEQW